MLAQLLRGVATGSLKEVSSEGWDAYSACTAQTRRFNTHTFDVHNRLGGDAAQSFDG